VTPNFATGLSVYVSSFIYSTENGGEREHEKSELSIMYLVASLRNGPCHIHIQNKFAPLVIRYVDLMESSIAQSVHNGFEKESWTPVG
jgi:hypothetical protein